jgi:hypothetical protein
MEPNLLLLDDSDDEAYDDDCNDFNNMNDDMLPEDETEVNTADGSDLTRPTLSEQGIIWLPQERELLSGVKRGNDPNHNDTCTTFSNFAVDEYIINKYFMAAIESHDRPVATTTTDICQSNIDVQQQLGSDDQDHIKSDKLKSWKPKELELPLWAVVVSLE